MKYTKAKKVSLTISYSLMFLGYGGCVIRGVVSVIGYFRQGLMGNAIFSIFLTIVIAALATTSIALHWDTMQELRQERKQADKRVKADAAPKPVILKISTDRLLPFFPPNSSPEDMEQIILAALEAYTHREN